MATRHAVNDRIGANEFEFKLGNYGCFNHNWWCTCGWRWDVRFTVNKNTGEVVPTYEWEGW